MFTTIAYTYFTNGQLKAAVDAANAAKSAADTASRALHEQHTEWSSNEGDFAKQFRFGTTSFSEQLQRLDNNIKAELRVARATEINASLAQSGLADERRNFLLEQRPWVFVSVPSITADPGSRKFMAQVYTGNYGKWPAVHVIVTSRPYIGPDAMTRAASFFAQRFPGTRFTSENILPPGVGSPATVFQTVIVGPLDQQTYDKFATSDNMIVLVGRVQYRDIEGHKYETDYCLSRLATSAALFCAAHNEAP